MSLREPLGLGLQIGGHRAEESRGAHRLRHVARPHQDGRRRIGAHALDGGQDLHDRAAAGLQRPGRASAARSLRPGETPVGGGDPPLRVLHPRGGRDQRVHQARLIRPDRVDFRLDAAPLVLGRPDGVLDAAQLASPCPPSAARAAGGADRRDRRERARRHADRGAERRGAKRSAATLCFLSPAWRRPQSSNLAGIAAVTRDDRGGRTESTAPGRAARRP